MVTKCIACTLLVMPLLVGCGAPDPTHPSSTSSLDCATSGYPCSLSEVDPDVLRRSEELSQQLLTMFANGVSMADATAFALAQAGVVDAQSNRVALRFRLDGGRDTWVLLPEALATNLDVQPTNRAAKATHLPDISKKSAKPGPNAHVVGDDPEFKHALVLSPFQYQFKGRDDGSAVAQILEGTRGYAGNVTYLENAVKKAGTVGIPQFKGWEQYDVILVTGHGSTMCQGTDCTSFILTGDVYDHVEELGEITDPGVNAIHVLGDDSGLIGLSPDFFRFHYGAGLERTIIFFNGCQTYGAGSSDTGSLSNALLGEGSVYLGWSDVVHANIAYVASVALYSNLADNGVTVQPAVDQLGSVAVDAYTSKSGAPIEALLLVDRPPDRDLRAREVITLEQPDGGGELTTDAVIAVKGKADDGMPDKVPYQVLIEGLEAGQENAAIVTVKIEGYSSDPTPASAGVPAGAHAYRLTGEIPYIDVMPSQTVEMRAEVQLPEGGTSVHTVSVILKAGAAREVWTGETTSSLQIILGTGVVNVSATVNFQQTETSVGKPTKRLRVTGGTMLWSRSGVISRVSDSDCSYSDGPIEVPIQAGDGEILIDTTTTPHTYQMHGSTQGPDVKVAQNCGDYAFTTSADGVWIPPITQFGQFFVSADGGTIEGSTTENNHQRSWSFKRQ